MIDQGSNNSTSPDQPHGGGQQTFTGMVTRLLRIQYCTYPWQKKYISFFNPPMIKNGNDEHQIQIPDENRLNLLRNLKLCVQKPPEILRTPFFDDETCWVVLRADVTSWNSKCAAATLDQGNFQIYYRLVTVSFVSAALFFCFIINILLL